MEPGTREVPYPKYSQEQFMADIETHLETDLSMLTHELQQLDVLDAHILETGAQRVRLERGKGNDQAAVQEIENSAQGFVDRQLKREEIQKKIEATKRALARLSPK